MNEIGPESVTSLKGRDFGRSRPFLIDQDRIDGFALSTEDHQWIHIDPERASAESPFGGTIAHGFLILGLLPAAHTDLGVYPSAATQVLNYGLDRARFIAPVQQGSTLEVRTIISDVTPKNSGRFLVKTRNEIYVSPNETPVAVADHLVLLVF